MYVRARHFRRGVSRRRRRRRRVARRSPRHGILRGGPVPGSRDTQVGRAPVAGQPVRETARWADLRSVRTRYWTHRGGDTFRSPVVRARPRTTAQTRLHTAPRAPTRRPVRVVVRLRPHDKIAATPGPSGKSKSPIERFRIFTFFTFTASHYCAFGRCYDCGAHDVEPTVRFRKIPGTGAVGVPANSSFPCVHENNERPKGTVSKARGLPPMSDDRFPRHKNRRGSERNLIVCLVVTFRLC